MPKFYKLEGGAVHRLSLSQTYKLITLEKGFMCEKSESHFMDCKSLADAQNKLEELKAVAYAKGYQGFRDMFPTRGIGEEYYLPEKELHEIILDHLTPPDNDNETIRESKQRQD